MPFPELTFEGLGEGELSGDIRTYACHGRLTTASAVGEAEAGIEQRLELDCDDGRHVRAILNLPSGAPLPVRPGQTLECVYEAVDREQLTGWQLKQPASTRLRLVDNRGLLLFVGDWSGNPVALLDGMLDISQENPAGCDERSGQRSLVFRSSEDRLALFQGDSGVIKVAGHRYRGVVIESVDRRPPPGGIVYDVEASSLRRATYFIERLE